MSADAMRIQFDTKTIDFFWLLGFSAWRAIAVYSPALVLATVAGMPVDQAVCVDAERGQYEFDYRQPRTDSIRRFRNNLFHGEKWAYQLQGQLSNFTHANAVLTRLLDRHGQLTAYRHLGACFGFRVQATWTS